MDNVQLAILLKNYARQLNAALDDAFEKMPDEGKVFSKNIIGTPTQTAPALDKLEAVIQQIENDINTLEGD